MASGCVADITGDEPGATESEVLAPAPSGLKTVTTPAGTNLMFSP